MKKYLFIFLVLQFSTNIVFSQNAKSTMALDLFHEGVFLYNQDKYHEAISKFESAIKINKKMAEAYFRNGLAYQQLDLHKEVIRNYSKAIRLNPSHHSAYAYRAYAYMQLGKYKHVIADYSKAIEMDSLSTCYFIDRGAAKMYLEDYRGAIEDFDHVLTMDSKSDSELATLYFLRGKADFFGNVDGDAIFDLDAAISRDTLNSEALVYLAYISLDDEW